MRACALVEKALFSGMNITPVGGNPGCPPFVVNNCGAIAVHAVATPRQHGSGSCAAYRGPVSSLQYQCTMSLDGFIAGPGGDLGWLARYAVAGNATAEQLMRATGALLVGRRTFGGGDPLEGTERAGEPYGGGWTGRQFVLTHRVPGDPVPGVTFMTDLGQAVAAAKQAAGAGKCAGVLGAHVAAQCVEEGLLDEVYVAIAPILLGGGVRLFDRAHGPYVQLEPMDLGREPGAGLLTGRYRVVY